MAMITDEAREMQLLKKLRETKPDETICLWGWEVETILKMLERGVKDGSEVSTAADCTGKVGGYVRGKH